MREPIFVTGATGFIGANLAKRLCKDKKNIIIYVPKNTKHPFLKGLKLKRINGDIRNYNFLLKAMKDSNYVYHLAAIPFYDPKTKDELFEINVRGTENVMRASLETGVKKVVHVSSTSVLGFTHSKRQKINENFHLEKENYFYAKSKIMAEQIVQKYVNKGLNATIVNPASVVGAGEVTPIFLKLVKNISKGRIKFAFPGTTCHIAVQDVVDGLLAAMKKGKKGERYILAGEHISFRDKYNLVAEILNKPGIKIELPRISYFPLYFLSLFFSIVKKDFIAPQALRHAYSFRNFDASKSKKELRWKPKITFERALRETVSYYKQQGFI